MTDLVRIFTFGGLRIEQNGKQFPPFTTRKEEALLVYLAATRRSHPREVLADLLWDERTQAQALANLRVVLSGLRQRLADYLSITRQMVGLEESSIWLDSNELEAKLADILSPRSGGTSLDTAEQLDRALTLYQGEFLSGFYVRDSQGFEDWILQERERFQRQVIEALHHLVEIYLNCGSYAAGIAQATRLLQMDPLREEAHQQIMKLLAQSGQRSAALNQYETCRRLLAKELGVEPSDETLALYNYIHTERITTAPVHPIVSSPTISIELANIDSLENPYKGLQAFQEQDSENFFGREVFVADLADRLKTSTEGDHFLALVGPSGSGKSSIIKAGLIPTLRRDALDDGRSWVIAEMVPGFQPLEELAVALCKVSPTPQTDLLPQLRRSDKGLLNATKNAFGKHGNRLLLVIDQFEELFTLVEDEQTRKSFLDNLYTAATAPDSPVYVLISLRADFYDRPMLYPDFGNLVFNNHLPVLSLTPDELERAIVQPAARIGVGFEPGLEATIISEVVEQPGMLPLLQYALTELYIHRQGRTLTLAAYREMGGVAGALSGRASELYAALDIRGQRAARQLFLRLVAPGETIDDTRRRVLRTEFASIAENIQTMDIVISLYGKFRLLTFDFDPVTHTPTVEIAHEALIRGWKLLREWLDVGREAVRLHRRLITAAKEWIGSGCETSYLATGERLTQFEVFTTNSDIVLNEEERAFLEASLAERSTQQVRESDRTKHEELLLRRSRTFLRALYLVGLGAVVGLLILTGIMLKQQQQAQYYEQVALDSAIAATKIEGQAVANFNRAESARLVREGDYIVGKSDQSVELAILLYIRALKITYLPEAETGLLNALSRLSTRQLFSGHTSWVLSVAFSPDGKYTVTGGRDNLARLWDTDTGKELRRFTGHTADINGVAVSSDGRYILTGSTDKTARLWNLATGELLRTFAGHADEVNSVAFSPDGRYILTGSTDKTACLWDLVSGQLLRTFSGHTGSIKAVTFSPDSKYVLTGSRDGTARLWGIFSGTPFQTFMGHTNTVLAVSISPDGKYVLTGSRDGTARLWDLLSGTPVQTFIGHRGWVTSVAFTPTGKVITGSRDGTARRWHPDSGKEIYRYVGHTNGIASLAVSPDGSNIVTGSMDNTARLWRIQPESEQDTLDGHNGHINSVVFSPDSQLALTGSDDGTARLWDVQTRKQLRVFSGHTDRVLSVAFSPNGNYVLTGSRDGTMRLWDVKTGSTLRIFSVQSGWASAVAFSPDGLNVATVDGADFSARLWKIETGAEVRQFVGHTRPIFALAFSADGNYLLTGSADSTARLWDTRTGATIRQYIGHTDFVVSVAFSPDSKYILTGSDDHTAILWDMVTGQQIRTFPQQEFGAYRVAFSPDGKYIATASGRPMIRVADIHRTIQLWNTQTGEKVRTVADPDIEIYSLAFSPDGKYLLAGQGYGSARLWIANHRDLIQLACSRIFADLTAEERKGFNITTNDATCAQ